MRMSKQLRSILQQIDDDVSRDLLTSDRTEHGDYLGIRSGQITLLPNGKETDKPYASKNRVRIKAARAARKFCQHEHTDAEYEQFHLALLTRAFSIKDLEIVKGEQIKRVYTELYDHRKQSRMLESCMANLRDERMYDLYVKHPDHVRMIVLWDRFKGNNVVVGRALVWKTNRGIYVDRIYGSEPAIIFIRNYVDNKGWMRYHTARSRTMRAIHVEVGIVEDYPERRTIPYLDTMFVERVGINQFTLKGTVYAHAAD